MKEKKIKNYLSKMEQEKRVDILGEISREINNWNGALEHLDYWENNEEFFNTYFDYDPFRLAQRLYFGDYNFNDDFVRFNGYGNIESISSYEYEQEMLDYENEIIDLLVELSEHLNISDETIENILKGK